MYNPVTSKLPDKNAHFRAAINAGKSVYDVDMLFGFPKKTLSGGSKFYNQASLVGGEDFYNNAALRGGAEFYNDAALRGGAGFYNDAALQGGAEFYNDAALRGGAEFYNDAALRGGAEFYNDAALRGGADFYNDAALRGGAEFYNDAALRGGAEFYNDAALRGGAEFYNDAALRGGAEFYNNAALVGGSGFYNEAALKGGFTFPRILARDKIVEAIGSDVIFIDWAKAVEDHKEIGEIAFEQTMQDTTSRDPAIQREWGSYLRNKPGSTLEYINRPYPEGSEELIGNDDIRRAFTLAYFSDSLKALIAINEFELDNKKRIKPDGTIEDDPYLGTPFGKKEKKEYLRALKYNLSNLMRYIKDESGIEFLVERVLKVMRGVYKLKTSPPPADSLKTLANQRKDYHNYDTRRALKFLYRGISPFKLYIGKEAPRSRRNKPLPRPKRPLTTDTYHTLRYGDIYGVDPQRLLDVPPEPPRGQASEQQGGPPRPSAVQPSTVQAPPPQPERQRSGRNSSPQRGGKQRSQRSSPYNLRSRGNVR